MTAFECDTETAPDAHSLLAAILESSAEAFFATDLNGTIVKWSIAAESLYGYRAAEIIGRHESVLARAHPGAVDRLICLADTNRESTQYRKDGSPVLVCLTRAPVRNSQGRIIARLVMARPRETPGGALGETGFEGRFRVLFEANPLPMWLYDWETWRFLEVNEAAVMRYGYTRAEFLAMHIMDIRPAEDVPALVSHLSQHRLKVKETGRWRHVVKKGTIIDVEIDSHIVDWKGRRAALVVAQDISERLRAAESLSESEDRFRTAFEHAPLGMCMSGLDGRFLQVNGALCKLLGYTREELQGDAWQKLTHPDDVQLSRDAVAQFRLPGMNSLQFEKRYIHKNGNTIWVRLRISVVKNRAGDPLHFITHVEDITTRRQAELALQESEEKYRSLITHIPDVVWVADSAGRVAFVSPNGERLIGLAIDEIYQLGTRALFEFIHPDDVMKVAAAFEMLFYGDQTYDVEFRICIQGGEWIWVHDRAVSTYERDGVRYASGLRSDVSERRRTEAALRARDAAEQANHTKSAFLANMSHELRTPLNAIIGYSQMLREDSIGADQPEVLADLEKIERSGQLLLGIINDVLDLSKIEAGRVDLKLQNIDVPAVLADVGNTVEPLARQQGNVVSLYCADDARMAYGDLPKFRQSLLNLVNNACKFTQHGRVSVAVLRLRDGARDWTEVRVADTGIGIRSEHLGKLFHPFSQVDDSLTRKYNGTGLGLAISKRFCQMMGGDIFVESAPGQGSCFSLRIPAAAPAARV